MDKIVGCWKFDHSKDVGIKAFLAATGVPEEMREPLMTCDPVIEWTLDGQAFTQKVRMPGEEERRYTYTLGEPFVMEKLKGLKFKCTITWDGKNFFEDYIDYKDEPFQNVRHIDGDTMHVTCRAKGLTMSQVLYRC